MKRIAILTSGGNSQGMNACLVGAGRVCQQRGVELVAIRNGFRGLVAGEMQPVRFSARLQTYLQQADGGSAIGCSRYPDFAQPAVQRQAQLVLKQHQIDGLIAIGGNGTYQGAAGLLKIGVKCVVIPGTIDNDVANTEYTVGFDTTANFVLGYLDRLRTTAESHGDCQIAEVMGRDCGDIAIYSGIAALADLIITKDSYLSPAAVIKRLQTLAGQHQRSALVVVVENLYDVHALARQVSEQTPYRRARASVIGYGQRGGRPSVNDRVRGFMMGVRAVEVLLAGGSGLELVVRGSDMTTTPLRSRAAQEHDHLLRLYQKYQF